MDAVHQLGLHYDVHNIYATLEARDTFRALRAIRPGTRPFIISRSSFVTHGTVSGTWSGDSMSTFFDLRNSISSMVRMNMFGISLTGSDICGFSGEATEVLCTRWYLLGAFYPFMRNHADHKNTTPFAFGDRMASVVRKITLERYKLLPFLYTLFYRASAFGDPVVQPLFMKWSDDAYAHVAEEQFTWGSAILFTPAFEDPEVVGYFPSGIWYDYWHMTPPFHTRGEYLKIKTPLDKINIHVFGGNIIPLQRPAMRTTESRKTPFTLLVYANSTKGDGILARGELFWDDGVTFDTHNQGAYNLLNFTLSCIEGRYKLSSEGYIFYDGPMALSRVEINGVPNPVGSVLVNNAQRPYSYDNTLELLIVNIPNLSMLKTISISWT